MQIQKISGLDLTKSQAASNRQNLANLAENSAKTLQQTSQVSKNSCEAMKNNILGGISFKGHGIILNKCSGGAGGGDYGSSDSCSRETDLIDCSYDKPEERISTEDSFKELENMVEIINDGKIKLVYKKDSSEEDNSRSLSAYLLETDEEVTPEMKKEYDCIYRAKEIDED